MSDRVRVAVVGLGTGDRTSFGTSQSSTRRSSWPCATSTRNGSRSSAAATRPCVGLAMSTT